MCVHKLRSWFVAAAVASVALAPSRALTAPAADVVVVWAPGAKLAPIDDVARRAGAAGIDRSPAADAVPATAGILKRAIEAYDALHRDVDLIVDPAEVEHRHDVLVRQAHRQPRLAHEQLEELGVAAALLADPIDLEQLLDARRPPAREEDLGHAATGERPQQLVATQRLAHHT